VADIAQVLRHYAPPAGRALEIASGTGQHVKQFAAALPEMQWQPSDVDPQRLASIDAWAGGAANVACAMHLDATAPGWGRKHGPFDLIVLINLLHLIREDEAQTIVTEIAGALASGGRALLYGPFLRAGELTSDGDAAFHASLTGADPAIGYKDDFDVIDWLHAAGLSLIEILEMPANNLCLISERRA
jgi:SAM-dependent methyltransferase